MHNVNHFTAQFWKPFFVLPPHFDVDGSLSVYRNCIPLYDVTLSVSADSHYCHGTGFLEKISDREDTAHG